MAGTNSVSDVQLTIKERCIAAAGAALVAAVVVNPLDVVKTRMQAHSTQSAGAHRILPSLMKSSMHGLWKITQHEGPSVLWHGVNVSMLISVPMICMYLPMYDFLMAEFGSDSSGSSSTYAPLLAGSAARTVSVVATSPLELLKTRIQAAGAKHTRPHGLVTAGSATPLSMALQQMRSDMKGTRPQQVSSLWRGVGASLAKDVPFAGLYWTLFEPSRQWLETHTHVPHSAPVGIDMHTLTVNAVAGSTAGATAAAVTTPFDVVKTKLQTRDAQLARKGTLDCLVHVAKTGGAKALFSGWEPRTLRTAAAYGILMSSYEICKGVYTTRHIS